jgi:alpha-1,3-fucosyltransferase
MSYIRIDSFGGCLNNAQSAQAQARAQSNSELYASYKFVISIENSNCEDYVTEKLIDGLSSTSVPIVASRDGKPDYARFAPNHSYINVYDFKTIKDLADYLNYLSNNETAYNEYLWFRQPPANKYSVKRLWKFYFR